jgi:peroxiredoxin
MFKNKKIKIIIAVFLLAFMLTFTFPSIAFADQASDVSSFVTRLYQTCLDRGPDPAGLDNWVSNLISGKVTGGQAAYGFVFSEELKNRNLNNDQFLAIMYRAFFDRPADIGGYNNWMGLLNGGSSREFVFSNFVNSTEFANICAKYGIQAGTVTANDVTSTIKKEYNNGFSLQDINGNTVYLGDYQGKVVVLNFWATWCGPCVAEIPDFVEVYNQYKNRGVQFIGVSLDYDINDVKEFVSNKGINYPVLMDTDFIVWDRWYITNAIPTTFILDINGNIITYRIGSMSKETLINLIESSI